MEKIDFVVTWVDGNDPVWLEERKNYENNESSWSNASNRFRDWALMRYWFRGVEKYAPWVHKVYFVTYGHYPQWLNTGCPKLEIIRHHDYIPQENLPTYNSNVIELYLNRIQSLNEHFVLFNDDTFLLDDVKETDFFQRGLPCDTVWLGVVSATSPEDIFPHTILNNSSVINKHFSKRKVIRKHWKKFFSVKYGMALARNLILLPFEYFSAIYSTHLPMSHLKSTFDEVWEKEYSLLSKCGTHRFRSNRDVTHWLMEDWRFCQGKFIPRNINFGKSFEIGRDTEMIAAIKRQKYKAICLNDSDPDLDFEKYQKELVEAFETILPEKSSFEI